ncbi:hypothetical protein [Rothia nasimurium]|uniref:hypothetical protein n=1 Tax=Rothia nasimurium TaxID=85336 RepID=UPI001431E5DA|nr:hypothetical protein [Rothia nasimurium]MBF0808292.1 hypothetical protein [Rothia nasimurium]
MIFSRGLGYIYLIANAEKIAELEKSIAVWKEKAANGGPAFIAEIIEKLEAELVVEQNS